VPSAEQNEAAAREFMERVFNQKDMAYAEATLAEDFVEDNPFRPDLGNDRAAALETIRRIHATAPDVRFELLDIVATEDRVAVRSRSSGTDSGTGWGAPMGAPATGRAFSIEGIDVVSVGPDGRYTGHYGLYDVPQLMIQLGLMPAPGG
jgi:steroid delta-isomerase-like uncharacterized protein